MNPFRKTSRLLVGAVATVTFAVLAIAPAAAASAYRSSDTESHVGYVALGDSYAFGIGAGDPATQSYPAVLAARDDLTLTNGAVSGATTYDVRTYQVPAQKDALKHARLVTLTVGGDDLGAIGVGITCALTPADCQAAIAAALAKLPQLYSSLQLTLQAIRAAAPHARIVVTGYPGLLDPSYGPVATELNAATLALNATIWAAAWQARLRGANVQYVSVVGPFRGHGIGSADSWINSSGDGALHPTTTGYRDGYALAIARTLAGSPFLTARAAA